MKLKNLFNPSIWILVIAIFLSGLSFAIFSDLGLITSYNDAMAHLNISRSIVDNMEPGLAQLGGVWLPMSHILPLFLIWNYSSWQSGFAGSVISMAAYILSVWTIYKTVIRITEKRLAGVVAAAAFGLNMNMLYLQSTPLTESLYLGFFCISTLYFIKWLKYNQEKQLLILGVLGFLQVLTRYDGWFVTFFETVLIGSVLLFYHQDSPKVIIGKLLLFLFPVAFGLSLWIAWNVLIFHDPLFFATGPYSAHAQQETIGNVAKLITKGDIFIATKAYVIAAIENVGAFVMLASLFGALILMLKNGILKDQPYKLLVLSFLLLPVLFNIVALYLGFSILNVPQLNWNPSEDPSGQWFNVRYGILALPFAAVLIGILASRHVMFGILAITVILFQCYVTFNEGLITVIDGTVGASSFVNEDIAENLKLKVSSSDKVLLATSFFSPVAFKSGVPLNRVIHEGLSKQWAYAVVYPENYSEWIVMANGDIGEPIYTSLIKNQKGRFLEYYQLEYKGEHANIYKLKTKTLVENSEIK